jgi:hypothetical protein
LDTSFGGDGKVTTDFSGAADYAGGMVVQSDGKIVVVGLSFQGGTGYDFALARYEGNSSVQSKINDVITGIDGSGLPAGTKSSLNAKLQAALAAQNWLCAHGQPSSPLIWVTLSVRASASCAGMFFPL